MSRDQGSSGTLELKETSALVNPSTPTRPKNTTPHSDSTPMAGRNQRRIYSGHDGKEYSHYIADGLLRSAIFSMISGVDRNTAINALQTKLKKLFESSFAAGFTSTMEMVGIFNYDYNLILKVINLTANSRRNLPTELNFIGEAHDYFASIDRAARVAPFRGFLQEININFLQAINYKSLSFQGNYFFNPHSPRNFIGFYSNSFNGKERYAFGNINFLNILFNRLNLPNDNFNRFMANLLETIALSTDSNIFYGISDAVQNISGLTIPTDDYQSCIDNISNFISNNNILYNEGSATINNRIFGVLQTNLSNSIAYLLWINKAVAQWIQN